MDLEADLTRVLHERSTPGSQPDVVAAVHAGMARRRRRQRFAQAVSALSVVAVAVTATVVLRHDPTTQGPDSVATGVPAGFAVSDLTFLSTTRGYALGSTPCGARTCSIVLRTETGAGDWTRVKAPAAAVASPDGLLPAGCDVGTCVSRLRFARDSEGNEVGYAFAPGFAVWDGEEWVDQRAPGDVEALEAAGGSVVRVRARVGGPGHVVERADVGRDDWAVMDTVPVQSDQVVLRRQGARLLLATYDNVTSNARMPTREPSVSDLRTSSDGGATWTKGAHLPCDRDSHFSSVSLGREHQVVVLCERQAPEGRAVSYVRESTDDGATFGPPIDLPAELRGRHVVTPSRGGWLVAADTEDGQVVVDSRDRGRTWDEVAEQTPGTGVVYGDGYLDNSSSSALWWVGPDARVVWRSQDGGETWDSATFR